MLDTTTLGPRWVRAWKQRRAFDKGETYVAVIEVKSHHERSVMQCEERPMSLSRHR